MSDHSIRPMLDLSTAHLDQPSKDWLDTASSDASTFKGCYGWVTHDREDPENPGHTVEDPDQPAVLTAILERACQLGCHFVLFDADGPIDETLPTFEEEPPRQSPWRWARMHPSIDHERVIAGVHRFHTTPDNPGFCISCGEETDCADDPNVKGGTCDHCGEPTVCAASVLLNHPSRWIDWPSHLDLPSGHEITEFPI